MKPSEHLKPAFLFSLEEHQIVGPGILWVIAHEFFCHPSIHPFRLHVNIILPDRFCSPSPTTHWFLFWKTNQKHHSYFWLFIPCCTDFDTALLTVVLIGIQKKSGVLSVPTICPRTQKRFPHKLSTRLWERPSHCVYQICIIYYVLSTHNIHQDKMQ